MLEQILLNLLENALRFAPPGSEILVGDGQGRRRSIELRVVDHGPGVPAEARDRIFEEFQSVDDRPIAPAPVLVSRSCGRWSSHTRAPCGTKTHPAAARPSCAPSRATHHDHDPPRRRRSGAAARAAHDDADTRSRRGRRRHGRRGGSRRGRRQHRPHRARPRPPRHRRPRSAGARPVVLRPARDRADRAPPATGEDPRPRRGRRRLRHQAVRHRGADGAGARPRSAAFRTSPAGTSLVHIDDLEVDLARRRVTRAGEVVHLTRTELSLLELLVRNPGKLLTQELLLREVWGPEYGQRATTCACTWVSCARSWATTRPILGSSSPSPASGTAGSRAKRGRPRLGRMPDRTRTRVAIVPHTHWDREWYSPFQTFRLRLSHIRGRRRGYREGSLSNSSRKRIGSLSCTFTFRTASRG